MRFLWLLCGLLVLSLIGGVWYAVRRTAVPEDVSVAEPEPERPTVVLAEAKQQLIWDAEHFTFEIETHVARPMAQAIATRNAEALQPFFRDACTGSVLSLTDSTSRQQSAVSELHYAAEPGGPTVDTAALVEFLLAATADFQTVDRNRLRVLQINPLNDERTHWAVEMLFTQHGSGPDGRLLALESHHQTELHFVSDEQIAEGRVIARWDVESMTVRSASGPLMEEVTEQAGLADLPLLDNWDESVEINPYRYQVAVEDFDRDGYPDICVASRHRAWLLKSMRGRTFVDVTNDMLPEAVTRMRPPMWGMPVWLDYNNDHYPDLIVGPYLFRNEEGREFTDVTTGAGLELMPMPMGCAVADYDGDGLLDLYVVYMDDMIRRATEKESVKQEPWVGDHASGCRNQLWRNEGFGRFRDVTAKAGVAGGARHTYAAVWFHLDDDHHPDLYLANDFGNNVLYRNRGDGTFEDVSAASGMADFATSMGVAAGDLDNDGIAELYVANMYSKMGRRIIAHVEEGDYPAGIFQQIEGSCAGNRLYQWAPDDGRFREVSVAKGVNDVGWAYGPAMVDFDGDGWLDLYAGTGYLSFDRTKPDG